MDSEKDATENLGLSRRSSFIWEPVETMPIAGCFLIGVWEGEWREPRQKFCVYEASGCGPAWARSYRTAEGEAYEIVGWMRKPEPPTNV